MSIKTKTNDLLHFIIQVARGRWLSLYASLIIMAGIGTVEYCYHVYSTEIKSSMDYDNSSLQLLNLLKDLDMGVLSGLISELTPTWFPLFTGAAIHFSSYFIIWLAVAGKLTTPKYWQMGIYIFLGANSHNLINTNVMAACVRNFPQSRGIIIGLLKGYSGLSGTIITQIYLALYAHHDRKSLLLFVSWLPAVIIISLFCKIHTIKLVREQNEVNGLNKILYAFIPLALILLLMTSLQKLVNFSRLGYVLGGAVVAFFLLVVPLVIVIKQESTVTTVVTKAPEKLTESPTITREDYSIFEALLSIDMIILFVSTMSGFGASLTAINNLDRVAESLGFPKETIQLASVTKIWNYIGRIIGGVVSEKVVTKYKCPRPLIITLGLILSSIAQLLIAFPIPGSALSIYVGSVIIQFSYGVHISVVNATISELFGLTHYASLLNMGRQASPLGAFILNEKIVGPLYDKEALKAVENRNLSGELICFGSTCFKAAFLNLALITFVAAAVSIWLVIRTSKFYKEDIYKKFKVDVEEEEEDEEKEMGLESFANV